MRAGNALRELVFLPDTWFPRYGEFAAPRGDADAQFNVHCDQLFDHGLAIPASVNVALTPKRPGA